MNVSIIDIGMGNLSSVKNAFGILGGSAAIVRSPEELHAADRIILPGVGAFGDAMARLREGGWIPVLREEVIGREKPFLGICLGMQVLATSGNEHGEHAGLGWIRGTVERLPGSPVHRIPHIGWNDVVYRKGNSMYRDMGDAGVFYFVHSYVLHPEEPEIVSGTCDHSEEFAASVQMKNIWATQYHPEKSQKAGLAVLKNFLQYGV